MIEEADRDRKFACLYIGCRFGYHFAFIYVYRVKFKINVTPCVTLVNVTPFITSY